MRTKTIALIITAFVASLSLTPAAFACASNETPECGGEDPPPPPPPSGKVKGNNGLGNGDQAAPGGSLTNNKAENEVGAPGHPSDKAQVENE